MKKSFRQIQAIILLTIIFTCASSISNAQTAFQAPLGQPGYYRMKVGDIIVTSLTDGTVPLNLKEVLTNVSPDEIDRLSKRSYQTATEETSVNAYLIQTNGKLILVDAGTAELYGPTLGHVTQSLKKLGFTPDQIDVVLVTHIHSDHTGGLMSGDQMVFPNATIYISQPEFDFWMGAGNKEKSPERLAHWFDEALAKVGPYQKAGKVKIFSYGKAILPGITPIASPGHTPGHTFYALESKGEKIMFVGDVIHAGTIQFPHPEVTIAFDVDPKNAAVQRIKAFTEAAKLGYWIAGDHVSFPGIGHLRAEGKGFVWVPINFSTLGTGQ